LSFRVDNIQTIQITFIEACKSIPSQSVQFYQKNIKQWISQ